MAQRDVKVFSSPTWIKATVGVLAIAMPTATALVLKAEGPTLLSLFLAAMSVTGLAALIEVALHAVVLKDDQLRIRTLTKRVNIPRADIAKVTWEGGSGASVQLNDGTWVELPEVGRNSQALTNSVRAWLKRGSDSASQ